VRPANLVHRPSSAVPVSFGPSLRVTYDRDTEGELAARTYPGVADSMAARQASGVMERSLVPGSAKQDGGVLPGETTMLDCLVL
jgi:hypothetical protein